VFALEQAADQRRLESARVMALRRDFEHEVLRALPESRINGSTEARAPHITSLTIPGQDNERLMMELDEAGIECAVGSACSASRDEASHVLSAIGLSQELARSTLRFSFGRGTSESDIRHTVQALVRLTDSDR